MKLTPENKKEIDAKSYESLLTSWRNSPSGNPWFEGETGQYWKKRMSELRETVDHVEISKKIGLGGPK